MGKVIVDLQTQFRRQFFFILLHCMGSANKMYCDNDKFLTLFLFRPLHSLHTCLIPSHALHSPNMAAPCLESIIYMQHHTTLRHAMIRYNIIV